MGNHKFTFGVHEIWELVRICVVMEVMEQMLLFPGSREEERKEGKGGEREGGQGY